MFSIAVEQLPLEEPSVASTNTKVEKDSDQNTTVLYEHIFSNDKNTMPELFIKQDKNSHHWTATKV